MLLRLNPLLWQLSLLLAASPGASLDLSHCSNQLLLLVVLSSLLFIVLHATLGYIRGACALLWLAASARLYSEPELLQTCMPYADLKGATAGKELPIDR